MTVIRQKRIIADKHIYESPEDFKKFTEGKSKRTVSRYSAYRRRSRDLLERGFNQKYDKKTGTYIYSKKGISRDDLKKTPKPIKEEYHYVHGIFFLCEYAGVEFEHTYHYESKELYRDSTGLAKHAAVFPAHEVINHEFLGSKVMAD